jgi:small subunit ribosomal protein S2
MAIVTMRQLLDSGVHFGHQTRRWNPKMKRFILTERNGIYIIDLGQTLQHIDTAYRFIRQTVAKGGSLLFIGTKKQAQEAVQDQATRVGMPYVNQRWLGGMLTNFQTISKRLSRLKELEDMNLEDAAGSAFTKKERLMMSRERDKLSRTLGGIRTMHKLPSAVWVVDTKKEHLAIDEARKLGIPIIAILDTNADPDEVNYAIPGNDDAIRAVGLLTRVMADAVAEGLVERHAAKAQDDEDAQAPAEPLAEWEQELLGAPGGAEALQAAIGRVDATAPLSDQAEAEVAAAVPQTSAVAKAEETVDGPQAQIVTEADAPAKPAPATDGTAADVAAAAAGQLPGTEITDEAAEEWLAQPLADAAAATVATEARPARDAVQLAEAAVAELDSPIAVDSPPVAVADTAAVPDTAAGAVVEPAPAGAAGAKEAEDDSAPTSAKTATAGAASDSEAETDSANAAAASDDETDATQAKRS